jgi:hypothetical protein
MTEVTEDKKPLHEKDETVNVVLKLWRAPEGRLSQFYRYNSALELAKVFQLTSTGHVHGEDRGYTDYNDTQGNLWLGLRDSDGQAFILINHNDLEFLIGDRSRSPEVRAALDLLRLRPVEREIGDVLSAGTQHSLIHAYHTGRASWEDISTFLPSFSGITQKGVDEFRVEFLAGYDTGRAAFNALFEMLKKQLEEITGKPFAETHSAGPMVHPILREDERTGTKPHYHVSLRHTEVIPNTDKLFEVHKLINAALSVLFISEYTGPEKFRRRFYKSDVPSTIEWKNHRFTARYAEHKNLDGQHTQEFVEFTSDELDMPAWVYL